MAKEDYERINEETKKLLFLGDEDRLRLVHNILECAETPEDRFVFVCFYLYGMRPSELIAMKRGWVTTKGDEVWIRIPTKKHGNERIIILDRIIPFMSNIIDFINVIEDPEAFLFLFRHPSNFNHKLYKILKNYNARYGTELRLTPYVFRKFRLSWLLDNGASLSDILSYKGGKSLKPLENSYIFLRPVRKFKSILK